MRLPLDGVVREGLKCNSSLACVRGMWELGQGSEKNYKDDG